MIGVHSGQIISVASCRVRQAERSAKTFKNFKKGQVTQVRNEEDLDQKIL